MSRTRVYNHHHHHHNHDVLTTRITLTLSKHPSLWVIDLCKLTRQHPVSTQFLLCLCVCVHRETSFMSSSLLLLNVLLVLVGWLMRWEVRGRTIAVLYSTAFRIYSKQHTSSCSTNLRFSSNRTIDTATSLKIYSFILIREIFFPNGW